MKSSVFLLLTALALPWRALGWTNGELMIWMDGDRSAAARQVAARFQHEFGINVTVESPEDLKNNFQMAAETGKGPDIVIWAHDKVGEWADGGLIAPIETTDEYRSRFFPKAWEAVSHQKQFWGYPISFEVVSLIFNKKFVNGAPPGQLQDLVTFNEQFKKANPSKRAILWDYNSPFYSWGILASAGAYIYSKTDTGFDVKNVGVADQGAVQALTKLTQLVQLGVLPRSASGANQPKDLMARGELAMTISGPWDWPDLTKSGIDFGLSPVPGLDGHPGKAFVGVSIAYLCRNSPNSDLAKEFLEHYLLTDQALAALDHVKPIGIPALKSLYNKLAPQNDLLRQMKVCVDAGEVMPNIPQMGRFWSAMSSALQVATNGQTSPQTALNDAKQSMLQ